MSKILNINPAERGLAPALGLGITDTHLYMDTYMPCTPTHVHGPHANV